MKAHLKQNWKKYALLAAAAGASAYGYDPEAAQSALLAVLLVFGL